MLAALIPRPIARIYGFITLRQPQVEEVTEQLQQASLDDQVSEPSPEMHQKLPNDNTNVSGDNPRTVGPVEGPHERRLRTVSGTTAHGHHGEPRTGDRLQSRLKTQTARLQSLENDHHQLVGKHELLEQSCRKLSEEHQTVVTALQETRATCKEQQGQIKTLRENLRVASASLDVRNQELKVAKTFLSKEDPFSTADVVRSVRDLNSEIMQTAAHLAENLPLKRVRTSLPEDVPEGPCKSIFVTLILPRGVGDEVGVELLELALQGFLAIYTCWIANTWGFGQTSYWCDELFSKLCEMGTST